MAVPFQKPLRVKRMALGLCASAAIVLPGCQQGNQQVYRDIYQRELRLQEDEIYRLEDCIKEYQGLIRGYRVELEEMKSRLDLAGDTGAAIDRPTVDRTRSVLDPPSRDRGPLPRDVFDEPSIDDSPGIELPSIDLGEPTESPLPPPIEPPAINSPLPDDSAPITPPPIDVPGLPAGEDEMLPLPADVEPLGEAPAWNGGSPEVSMLPDNVLGDASVEGYAGQPLESGEATVVALVRPLTTDGKPCKFTGPVSLMLIDPTNDKRLARWDFTPDEIKQSWRPDSRKPTLDLAIVLPDGAPHDKPLELWIRLTDPYQEKVLKRAEVVLDQLASIDQAPLASADLPELSNHPLREESIAQSHPNEWRASDRTPPPPPVGMAKTRASDSGWNRSDALVEPRKINLASHEEEAKPLPVREDPEAPTWSPRR